MKYSLLIFDWDGTLMDSLDKIVESVKQAALLTDVEIPSSDAIRNIIGLSLDKAMEKLFPEHSKSKQASIIEAYRNQYRQFNASQTPFYPGVKDWLVDLKNKGYLLAVATGKGRNGLNNVLESHGVADLFSVTYCADETASKPHPLMLNKILSDLQVSVEQAIMIGDSSYDLEMANNANMACVGVSYGVHCHHVLSTFQPLAILDDLPSQLGQYI